MRLDSSRNISVPAFKKARCLVFLSGDLFFVLLSCIIFVDSYSILGMMMQTTVTKRGQTVVPAEIRRRHQIEEGDQLVWIDDGHTITVVPVPADPVRALRGRGRGEKLLERLISSRQEDRDREP